MINRQIFFNSYRENVGKLSVIQVEGLNALLAEVEKDSYFQVWTNQKINELAYMLATVRHETANTFKPIEEFGSDKYLEKYDTGKLAKALGNTPADDGDGQKYKGRGFVQITGLANYKKASDKLKIDLVKHPEKTLEPSIAYRVMSLGMREGWFTGKKLDDYIPGKFPDFFNARKIINGLDKANVIMSYALVFKEVLSKAITK